MANDWTVSIKTDIKPRVRAAAIKGLGLAGEHILGVANEDVPIEEGTLERSGGTSVDPAKLACSVFYDSPYAVRQHEELGYRHDDGRTAKFLENAFNSESTTAQRIIGMSIRGELA